MNDATMADKIGRQALNLCQEYVELDNVFPDIDYRNFADREQKGK
jgi:hypothetical protein